jgi:hypothetical protein
LIQPFNRRYTNTIVTGDIPGAGLPPNPEICLALAALLAGLAAAWFRRRWVGWWERPLARLARRKKAAILAAAVAPLMVRAALLPWFPPPEPRVHDEFSFLLAADTFAHGRLANPPHPMWVHFESIHILARPTYASAFPIAPAAFLAVGMVLFGSPWIGVMLGIGLMCGAACWMLQGWTRPRWALLGALLWGVRVGVSGYWMNGFWGGAVAAAGGALALGALARIVRKPDWRMTAVMGAGFAILFHSRPYEGGVLGLAIGAALLVRLTGKGAPDRKMVLRQVALPLCLLVLALGAASAWYFYSVTGNPLLLPYSLDRRTMTLAPHFIWQSPRPEPLYNNAVMRGFYTIWEMHSYELARNSLRTDLPLKLATFWRFYFGPLFTLPLLGALLLWRNRRVKLALLMVAALTLALIPEVWHLPHYAAPGASLAMFLVVMGMRRLGAISWRGRRWGLYFVRSLPAACVAMLIAQIAAGPQLSHGLPRQMWRWPETDWDRPQILGELRRTAGRHLVFVRYDRRHDPGEEWVYNGADIDGSKVVWARELDPESNARLMRYFSGRKVWLVEPDQRPPRLVPYADAPFQPMEFVQLGAPGIPVLRDVDNLKARILKAAGTDESAQFTCDVWSYHFLRASGVIVYVNPDCYGAGRGRPVSFDHYFAWLRAQR